MELDGQLAESQTEAGAAAAAPGALVEAIEDVWRILRVDAGPGVADTDDDGSLQGAVARAFDADLPAARRVLDRVREKVRQDANDEAVVDEDVGVLRQRAVDLDAFRESFGGHLRHDRLERLGEVIDAADLESLAQVLVAVLRGDEDHRDIGRLRL